MEPKNKTIILTPDEIDKLLNACWIAREHCTGESQEPYIALIEKLEDVQNGGEM